MSRPDRAKSINRERRTGGLPPDILAMARYLGTVAPDWTEEQVEQLRPLCAQIQPPAPHPVDVRQPRDHQAAA